MPGRATAVRSGADLRSGVAELGRRLGLDARTRSQGRSTPLGCNSQHRCRAQRDSIRETLGVECKFQGGGGSAEEKVPATIQDLAAWPIPGIVVFGGQGFSTNMIAYFHSTGKAVALYELEPWLRLFFGLP